MSRFLKKQRAAKTAPILSAVVAGVIRFRSSKLSKVILKGFIVVPDLELEVIKRELTTHTRLTLEETGCLIFTVTQDEDNIHKFNVYEEFINQSAFDNHQSRVKSSKWGEVTKNVERNYKIINRSKRITSCLNGIKTVGHRFAIITNYFSPLNETLFFKN